MKILGVAALLVLVALSGASAQAAYDSGKVVEVMHINGDSLRAAKAGIDATDPKAAATAFDNIVKADRALLAMNPPKGSKADWDQLFNDLIAAATKGSAAAGGKDWTGATAALGELRAIMKKGHTEFRG